MNRTFFSLRNPYLSKSLEIVSCKNVFFNIGGVQCITTDIFLCVDAQNVYVRKLNIKYMH